MIPHLQLFSIFLLLCVGAISSAQPLREIEFSVYGQYPVRGIEYTPISEAAIATGAKADPPVSIKTHSLTRMGPHIFKGGDQITFQDASSKEQVAQVHLTAESDKWLLIFVKNPSYKEDPSNNSKYLIYAFDDSPRNLPTNSAQESPEGIACKKACPSTYGHVTLAVKNCYQHSSRPTTSIQTIAT